MMKCPYCDAPANNTCDHLPDQQEERVFFKCHTCDAVFAGWWEVVHYAEKLEDGGPYDGEQAAAIAEAAAG